MSGHKRTTVSISETEYRRLHEAEMKLRFMDKYLPETLDQAKQETNAAIQRALEAVETRQQNFARQTSDLQEDVKAVEWATSQAIIEQTAAFTENLQDSLDNLRHDLLSEIEQFSRQFKAEIVYDHAQNQAEFRWIRQQFDDQAEEHQRKKEIALAWAQSAALLDQFIQENYPLALIDPQTILDVENELRQVFVNLEQEAPEAALAMAQHTYFKFSRLRVELENKILAAELLYQTCYQSVVQLLSWMETVRQVPALDLEGNPTGTWVDVDYWTDGRLQQLTEYVREEFGSFVGSEDRFDLERLKNLIERALPACQKEAEELVFQARLSAINSQIRINIAELIVRALQEQGFQLQDGNYRNDDMRDGFEALVQSLDGGEVLIRVDPLENQDGSADVHLISLDRELKTEQELTQRARELGESLERYGLSVGSQKTSSAYRRTEEPAQRRVAEVRQAYASAEETYGYP